MIAHLKVAVAAVIVNCLLSACGTETVVIDSAPGVEPFAGPLDVAVDHADAADVKDRSGSAGLALECAGEPDNGGGADYDSGLASTQSSADKAVANWMNEEGNWFGGLPQSGYRVERDDGDRVLLSLDVANRSKATIVVGDAISDWRGDTGWGVESWAVCDPSEFPPSLDKELGVQVWERADGSRVSTSVVTSYLGPEHCDWDDITFLRLGDHPGGAQFVRDTRGEFDLLSTYDDSATLPTDATDTGFEREGKQLWLSESGDAAYLVDLESPAEVERWPAAGEPIMCM